MSINPPEDFSQHGEYSNWLVPYFQIAGIGQGFFVDIGAPGEENSNTLNLAIDGWHGLWVEPHPKSYAQAMTDLAKYKLSKQVKVAQVAVAGEGAASTLPLYEHDIPGQHSLIPDWKGAHPTRNQSVDVIVVRLDELFRMWEVPSVIDLLDLDTEGVDEAILMDLIKHMSDWEVRPKTILWEATPTGTVYMVRRALRKSGYFRLVKNKVNEFWVSEA